jgi:hypothetical protein
MSNTDFQRTLSAQDLTATRLSRWYDRLHVDPILVMLLTVVIAFGLVVLRSAVAGNEPLYDAQLQRIGVAYVALIVAAQIPPHFYLRMAPLIYLFGLLFLVLVLFFGVQVKGSQRWLDIPGLFRFQAVRVDEVSGANGGRMVSTEAQSATVTQIHVGLPLHYLSAGLTDRQAARFGHQYFSLWRWFFGTPVSRASHGAG